MMRVYMDKITVKELGKLRDDGKDITVIDSRSDDAWNSSDVKARAALRVPPDQEEEHLDEIGKDLPIVVYCT